MGFELRKVSERLNLPKISSQATAGISNNFGPLLRVLEPYLTERLDIGGFFSQGTVFSRKSTPAYISQIELISGNTVSNPVDVARLLEQKPEGMKISLKSPAEILGLLIAESVREGASSAATIYIDITTGSFMPVNAGITAINLLEMKDAEIEAVLKFAKQNNVTLDYHAPWLSKSDGVACYSPTPRANPEIFARLTRLAEIHARVFGKKPQVTIHPAGSAEDWKEWVEATRPFAQLLIENAFSDPKEKGIKDSFVFFQKSDFHSPDEATAFAKAVGINEICFDQAHAFGGYRHANGGIFDPIGELKYLDQLLQAGLNIARLHRAAVPRELSGQERGDRTVDKLDTHRKITPFTQDWYLQHYPQEEKLIRSIFRSLAEIDARQAINVTFEILPEEFANIARNDIETRFR